MKRIIHAIVLLVLVAAALGSGVQPAQAQSGNQWTVQYFNNNGWQGAPVYTQFANLVSFNWGSDTSPAPGVPNQNWTATLSTSAFFYAGIYEFQITADDEFQLTVNGVVQGSTVGQGLSGKTQVYNIPFNQGNSSVVINFRQFTGPAYLFVNWTLAKGATPAPPPPPPPAPPAPPAPDSGSPQPFPPPASITTQFGDYTRCAQQNIHQSNCFVSNGAWNAPNMGSIQMEPIIVRWQNCTADSVQNVQLYQNRPAQNAACSKTEAGWFAR